MAGTSPATTHNVRRRPSLVGGEAVEQTRAAGRLQIILTAATRAMRGVPRYHMPGGLEAGTVVMTHDGRAFAALGPVPAGGVATSRREIAHWVRAGQNIMLVRLIAAPLDGLALLAQRRLLGEIDVVRVQVVQALRDHHALGVVPRALADAIARIDAGVAAGKGRAQVSAPIGERRAGGARQRGT